MSRQHVIKGEENKVKNVVRLLEEFHEASKLE
jgi:hypothetical protein